MKMFGKHFETYIHLVNDTHRENCPSNVGKGSSITIQWWFVSLWCVNILVFSSLQKSITECAYGEMDKLWGWNRIDTHAYDWLSTSWDNVKRKQQITRAQKQAEKQKNENENENKRKKCRKRMGKKRHELSMRNTCLQSIQSLSFRHSYTVLDTDPEIIYQINRQHHSYEYHECASYIFLPLHFHFGRN